MSVLSANLKMWRKEKTPSKMAGLFKFEEKFQPMITSIESFTGS